mgnify:CR=1 FL=1|tara:strand:- start:464 stop:1132 length:669 start_codon:yes stop_codon:yes gene_type:complete
MRNEDLIQQLLETKSFDSLTIEEREKVLSVMSEEEFISRGEVVRVSKNMLNEGVRSMTPSPSIKSSAYELMEQRKENNRKSFVGMFSLIFSVKIPAYQFVVALALVVFLLPPLLKNEIKQVATIASPEKEIAYIHDTVFLDKIIPEIVEVEKVKYVRVNCDPVNSLSDGMEALAFFEKQSSVVNQNSNSLELAKEQIKREQNNRGQSSSDRDDLNQFIINGM